ncbi:unnamed protein product [Adineta steineri]|uniref:Uncharacterized protein n=1 Tax=Adineta steineri TaxID=433720 RepID=A0A813UUG2_9BILA|nr:unnamed protein product [Adineta steineri]CAF0832509.1 unnamed protein product [Adineta steineri]CAF0963364.1 unnamed protein product [Adineta steineri]CAF3697832.1 unnamed protein product [Adineta steineri]CAF4035845.1 unnamed protein product [Adineta steineri]
MTNNNFDMSDDGMDIDGTIYGSGPMIASRDIHPNVFPTSNLLDAIKFILTNNTKQRNNETLTEYQEEIFQIVEKFYTQPQTMFEYLRKNFAKYFDIDLYPIVFENENFSLITENNYEKNNKAYLSFNKDNTVHGPLYKTNVNGTTETVFSANDNIQVEVYMFVMELNDKIPPCNFPLQKEQSAASCIQESIENSSFITISTSNNQVIYDHPEKTQSRALLDATLRQIFQLFDNLPIWPNIMNQTLEPFLSHIATFKQLTPEDCIVASEDIITRLSYLIQAAKPSIFNNQNNSNGNVESITLPSEVDQQNIESNSTNLDAHNTLQNEMNPILLDVPIPDQSPNVSRTYDPPTMDKPLKSPFHPRTLKEYAATSSSPVQSVRSKQREPLHIGVPPDDDTQLYLAMEAVTDTDDNEGHVSKFLVPDKTKLKDENLINMNDLRCLNFDKCHKDYTFNNDTKQLYAKISSQERDALQKDIRIHMLNLYQRGSINRKMVNEKGLKRCKLALWFCTLKNGAFSCVSPRYYSNVIEERKLPKYTSFQ